MPSSQVFAFADPGQYAVGIRAADVTVTPTTVGAFRAEIARIDFERLWMQRVSESAPLIKFSAVHRARAPILFLTRANQPAIRHGGVEVSGDDIVVYGAGASIHHRTTTSCEWGSMSLSPDGLATAASGMVGRELSAPADTYRVRPDPEHLAHLRELHAAAGKLAWSAPDVLAHPEAARSLEDALTRAMLRCLTDGERLETDRTFRNHLAVMARRLPGGELGPPALSPRDLRRGERVGTNAPALLSGASRHGAGALSVAAAHASRLPRSPERRRGSRHGASVAMAHGFWELGRFSVAYRGLFGETPLTTLRRPPDDAPRMQNTFPLPVFA